MNPRVKSVRPLEHYELEISFESGELRRFDVSYDTLYVEGRPNNAPVH